MPETTKLLEEYTNDFCLDEQKFREIVEVLRKYSSGLGKPTYMRLLIHRENDSFYETDDVNELMKEGNAPPKEIEEINILVHKTQPDPEESQVAEDERTPVASITFSTKNEVKIRFRVIAENKGWSHLLANELNSQIKQTLKWALPIFCRKRAFDLFICLVIFILAIVAPLRHLFKYELHMPLSNYWTLPLDEKINIIIPALTSQSMVLFQPLLISLISLPLILLIYRYRPLSKLFNGASRSVFYWGEVMDIYDKFQAEMKFVKWAILAGIFIGGVMHVIAKASS